MFGKDDKTYDELREKSIAKWLEDMSQHEDVEVRGGIKLTRGYIDDLHRKIKNLESKNALKDEFLMKLKQRTK